MLPDGKIDFPEKVLLMKVSTGSLRAGPAEEMESLVRSAGGKVAAVEVQNRNRPDPKYFVGKGKAVELRESALAGNISTIVFNRNLTPGQASRLEKLTRCKIIDRTELILAIFAWRARTTEAKLQIELAQLRYSLPRLSGMWHHFSRLGAGIGTRGPGETQLEIDRRRARTRIGFLERRIRRMESRWRVVLDRRSDLFEVAVVGYTNAGKSTLVNALCGTKLYTEDKPFATLDTTSRRLELPDGSVVLVSDTVGFIDDLPETLVASFHTTLDVARNADLLLVAVDRSSPYKEIQLRVVKKVLDRIGVDGKVPRLTVWTKCDLAERHRFPGDGVPVSSMTGAGLDELRIAVMNARDAGLDWFEVLMDRYDGGIVNWLYTNCVVKNVTRCEEDGSTRIVAGITKGCDALEKKLLESGLLRRLRILGKSETGYRG